MIIKGTSGREYVVEQLLFADELADALRRSRCYVYAMKAAGFEMPGGTATLNESRAWLRKNPNFSTTSYIKKTPPKPAAIIPPLEVNFN